MRALRELLSAGDFRRLCAAQVFGGLGTWLATLALMALVWERTGSAIVSGLVLAFRLLPGAMIGSFLGSLVDRFDRRRVLVACTAGRACVYAALPFVGGLAPVLALALVAEIATIAYQVARDATLPRLVPARYLPAANATSMASSWAALPVGSALFAGLTVAAERSGRHGVAFALVAAAVMLGVATLLVGRIRPAAAVAASDPGSSLPARGSWVGLRAAFRGDPVLRRLAVGALAAAAGGGATLTLGMAYVRDTLQTGNAGYGVLLASFSLGAAAGAMAIQRARRHLPKVFHVGVGVMGAILVGMALFPSEPVGFGMSFLFGGAFVSTLLGGITTLQDRVCETVRGRAFAVAHSGLRVGAIAVGVAAAWGAKMLGSNPRALAGLSLDGTQVVLALAGLLLVAAGLLLFRPHRASVPA